MQTIKDVHSSSSYRRNNDPDCTHCNGLFQSSSSIKSSQCQSQSNVNYNPPMAPSDQLTGRTIETVKDRQTYAINSSLTTNGSIDDGGEKANNNIEIKFESRNISKQSNRSTPLVVTANETSNFNVIVEQSNQSDRSMVDEKRAEPQQQSDQSIKLQTFDLHQLSPEKYSQIREYAERILNETSNQIQNEGLFSQTATIRHKSTVPASTADRKLIRMKSDVPSASLSSTNRSNLISSKPPAIKTIAPQKRNEFRINQTNRPMVLSNEEIKKCSMIDKTEKSVGSDRIGPKMFRKSSEESYESNRIIQPKHRIIVTSEDSVVKTNIKIPRRISRNLNCDEDKTSNFLANKIEPTEPKNKLNIDRGIQKRSKSQSRLESLERKTIKSNRILDGNLPSLSASTSSLISSNKSTMERFKTVSISKLSDIEKNLHGNVSLPKHHLVLDRM